MKKDKNLVKEMKDKKRLQNLVWDGLSNSLENQPVDNKKSNSSKQGKKGKKSDNKNEKPENSPMSE